MAAYYFLTGNTNSAANWSNSSGGAGGFGVPGVGDDAIFDANSGNGTINALLTVLTVNFTGYVSTLTYNANLAIRGTSINFGSGFIFTGTGNITIDAQVSQTITITSSGLSSDIVTVPLFLDYVLVGGVNFTIVNNLYLSSLNSTASSVSSSIAGNDIYVAGNVFISNRTLNNTNKIILNGTGSLDSTTGTIQNLSINTAGIITILTIRFGTVLEVIAGTIDGANANVTFLIACTLNLTISITLKSVRIVSTITVNTSTLSINDFTMQFDGGFSAGTGQIKFITSFTTTIQHFSSAIPVTIQPSTTFTMNALDVTFNNTLTLIGNPSNFIINITSFFCISNTTGGTINVDMNNCTINGTYRPAGSSTVNHLSNFVVNGTFNHFGSCTHNGSIITILGDYSATSSGTQLSGTTVYNFSGNSKSFLSTVNNAIIASPVVIDGFYYLVNTILIAGTLNITGRLFCYIYGNITMQWNSGATIVGAKRIRNLTILNLAGNITADELPDGNSIDYALTIQSTVSGTQRNININSGRALEYVRNVKIKDINVTGGAGLGVLRKDWNLGNNVGNILHISQYPHAANSLRTHYL